MSDEPTTRATRPTDDSMDVVAEARSLRRRLLFWKRAAYLLLGLALVIAVVLGNRTTIRCRECEQALTHYAELVSKARLEQQPPEVVVSVWADLDPGEVALSPGHYALFVQNWFQPPGPEETRPLAMCGDSHVRLLNRGRHVLYRDAQRTFVRWVDEDEAQRLLKQIPRIGRIPPLSISKD